MAWHDRTPWRRRQEKQKATTLTGRLDEVERQCSEGRISLHAAIHEAYLIGIEAGRANPVIQRIGQPHDTEVET